MTSFEYIVPETMVYEFFADDGRDKYDKKSEYWTLYKGEEPQTCVIEQVITSVGTCFARRGYAGGLKRDVIYHTFVEGEDHQVYNDLNSALIHWYEELKFRGLHVKFKNETCVKLNGGKKFIVLKNL